MRGLKPFTVNIGRAHPVASFTDAWIETLLRILRIYLRSVASFTDAWIETNKKAPSLSQFFVASFTDAWIETGILYVVPLTT